MNKVVIQMLDSCRERHRTRDRLLEYDQDVVPYTPHTAGLPLIYPWENITLSVLQHQIFEIAEHYGFIGTENDFFSKLVNIKGGVVNGTIATFPVPGEFDVLYLDNETDTLYYFKILDEIITQDTADEIDAVVVETSETTTSLYIPVRALLLENSILNSGNATEYID